MRHIGVTQKFKCVRCPRGIEVTGDSMVWVENTARNAGWSKKGGYWWCPICKPPKAKKRTARKKGKKAVTLVVQKPETGQLELIGG